MKTLILIKLGGSLITDKTKTNVARLNVIENLTKQIKETVENNKNLSLIIATGAGGFGHPVAKIYEHNLEKGIFFIKAAVKALNQIIVTSLVSAGVSAISVEPSKVSEYKNGKMFSLSDGFITSLLEKNIIPVFHADLVKDQLKGISILSMDRFLVDLAIFFKNKNYEVEKVIFAGTTAGVVSRVGTTIKKITKNNFSIIREVFYKGKGIDVTGGMKYKVEQCLRLAEEEIDSYITNDLLKKGTQIK
mgnify:FL=1